LRRGLFCVIAYLDTKFHYGRVFKVSGMPIDPKNFTTEQRRIDLAEKILSGDLNQNELADYYGVAASTITADKKSKEFAAARNEPLVSATIKGIYEAVKAGNLQAMFHVSDKLCIFKPDEADTGANPAIDALSRIFGAGTSEVENLKRENAEMKSELDEIKRRLSALNGQGAAILDGLNHETPGNNNLS